MKKFEVRYLNKDEFKIWDEFVEISPMGNIFNKSFWLNAVCDKFNILVYEENGKIAGGIALPHNYKGIYRMPKLTPQLGVLLPKKDEKAKYSSSISKEIDIVSALIGYLPKYYLFDYNFNYNFTNFLPFIWNDFNVGIKYTYVIEDLTNIDNVFSNFQYDIKYAIKKAVKCNVSVVDNLDIEQFYNVNKKTFDRQKMQMPYTLGFLKNLDEILEKNNCRKMLFALNDESKVIAAVYLIFDRECTYYLMGGADPEYRNTEAQTLLIWEGIKFASTVSKKFDFEGSMVKNIEHSFRGFGGTQKILYNVYKSNFVAKVGIRILQKNKNIIRKIWKV